jgi:transketolase
VLALSRQDLPVLHPDEFPALPEGALRGGYIISEAAGGDPEAIIIATGSEVALALAAQKLLIDRGGRRARVVSLPSWEIFEEQPPEYRETVLPPRLTRRLAVEAGLSLGWNRYVGEAGRVLSIENYGISAPAARLFKEYGFTPEHIAGLVEEL